ncbi:MAG: stage II sporulation protein M [Candidatus Binatia bacterium]
MQDAAEKLEQWTRFYRRAQTLLRSGRRALRRLSGTELAHLIDEYQALTADLARARSLGAARETVDQLNRIAVAGHNLLYGQIRLRDSAAASYGAGSFPRLVRKHAWAVALSAMVFFGAALASFVAVQFHPALGYDLLADEFLDFDPASRDNLHSIPSLARPVVSSLIISNNIQVTLLAFGLGLTAGIGTTVLLIFNGVHLGSVAGWMMLHGKDRALWGWIMPHGGTELLAICLAGAAGYVLAGAIVAPGQVRRSTALKNIGGDALGIELGCMVMLVIAGLIEGFVSPSGIDYSSRVGVLIVGLALWAVYFLTAGRKAARPSASDQATQPTSSSHAN